MAAPEILQFKSVDIAREANAKKLERIKRIAATQATTRKSGKPPKIKKKTAE